jgi:hypothetical protein
MKLISFLVLAALVAGCSSGPSSRWAKGGATTEDFRLDQDDCAATSRSYDFALEDRDSGRIGIVESGPDARNLRGGSAVGDVYRRCMEDRGWRRERGAPPLPQ